MLLGRLPCTCPATGQESVSPKYMHVLCHVKRFFCWLLIVTTKHYISTRYRLIGDGVAERRADFAKETIVQGIAQVRVRICPDGKEQGLGTRD
jgi:hypothetical protein